MDTNREPPALTEAHRQELDRRLAALDANQSTVNSWEEVEARVLAKLRGERSRRSDC